MNARVVPGDRIIVTEGVLTQASRRPACPQLLGLKGIVRDEDIDGMCVVVLDGGSTARLWNIRDIKREEAA